jgi:hypothetical protein
LEQREIWHEIRRFRLLIVAGGALLSVVQPAPAGADSLRATSKCTALVKLVTFVSSETNYPPLLDCPRVRLTTNSALRGFLGLNANYRQEQPLAMYVPMDAEILIGPEVEVTSTLGQSYLVHELVHAHQMEYEATRRAPCPGWLEGEAYRVQASYLKTRGLTKDAFAMETIGLLQGSCAQVYHPELILQ